MMSAPSARWTSIVSSGERKWDAPSIGDRNSTPSSVIRRSFARLQTWKPPESVRSAPSQPMKRSEEHTSELQSPCNLVCRLLLEKKKNFNRHLVRRSSSYYYGHQATVPEPREPRRHAKLTAPQLPVARSSAHAVSARVSPHRAP